MINFENQPTEPFKVDFKPFIESQEKALIDTIVRPEDVEQGEDMTPMEKMKRSLSVQLKEMVDFLSTTEEDRSGAVAFYTNLYKRTFKMIDESKSIDDIGEALNTVKFEDINARFFETIKGNWKTLGVPKRRGIRSIESPTVAPQVNRIILELASRVNAFRITKKALTEQK